LTVKQFAEHFDAGADGLLRVSNTDDFDFFADLDNPRSTRPVTTVPRRWNTRSTGIRKAPSTARSGGGVGVQGVGQFHDGFFAEWTLSPSMASLALPWMMGCRRLEIVLSSSSHFHFNEFEQFGVDHVALVEEHDDVWHANLTGQQDVLAGLGHWAVSGGTHQMAPSIWAAPVIMFSHSQRGLGSPWA
jgi:hypothetical protein